MSNSRCPGSGLQMVYRTYVVRQIEEADQVNLARNGTYGAA
jgi:hypothetical protein